MCLYAPNYVFYSNTMQKKQVGILFALTQNSGLISSQSSIFLRDGKITNFEGISSHFGLIIEYPDMYYYRMQ